MGNGAYVGGWLLRVWAGKGYGTSAGKLRVGREPQGACEGVHLAYDFLHAQESMTLNSK